MAEKANTPKKVTGVDVYAGGLQKYHQAYAMKILLMELLCSVQLTGPRDIAQVIQEGKESGSLTLIAVEQSTVYTHVKELYSLGLIERVRFRRPGGQAGPRPSDFYSPTKALRKLLEEAKTSYGYEKTPLMHEINWAKASLSLVMAPVNQHIAHIAYLTAGKTP